MQESLSTILHILELKVQFIRNNILQRIKTFLGKGKYLNVLFKNRSNLATCVLGTNRVIFVFVFVEYLAIFFVKIHIQRLIGDS